MEEEEEMWFNEEDDFSEEIDNYSNVMKCKFFTNIHFSLQSLCKFLRFEPFLQCI